MICPKCGNSCVTVQTFQEDGGTVTTSTTSSKYREKGHGLFWWLLIGWWWWVVDLCLWIFFFVPRLLVKIFHKKKYVGRSSTVSTTVNNVIYRTVCTCQQCGHTWTSGTK